MKSPVASTSRSIMSPSIYASCERPGSSRQKRKARAKNVVWLGHFKSGWRATRTCSISAAVAFVLTPAVDAAVVERASDQFFCLPQICVSAHLFPTRMNSHRLALIGAFALLQGVQAETLKINGSTTVNLPVAEAAEILRAEKRMQIQVDTQGGSSGGISMLGDGQVQIGMSSKPVSDADRTKFSKVTFRAIHIGEDAVALIVSRDVWEAGVHEVTQQQIQ